MPIGYYDAMSDIESKGKYNAHREGSQYYGKYQFHKGSANPYLLKIDKTWKDYKNDPKVQEKVARMETANNTRIMKGWGKEAPSDLDLWTAHNLGIGNMRKIHSGNVTDKNLLKAVRNQAGSPQDVAAYQKYYGAKFAQPVPGDSPKGVQDVQPMAPPITPLAPSSPNHSVASLFGGLGSSPVPAPTPAPGVYVAPNSLFEGLSSTKPQSIEDAANGLGTFKGFN